MIRRSSVDEEGCVTFFFMGLGDALSFGGEGGCVYKQSVVNLQLRFGGSLMVVARSE